MTGSDRLAELADLFEDSAIAQVSRVSVATEDAQWLVAALVAERALSDALAAALDEFMLVPEDRHVRLRRGRAKAHAALSAHRSARAGLT